MKRFLVILICISVKSLFSQSDLTKMFFIQQSGMYYSSDRMIAYGYGIGSGLRIKRKQIISQADVNLLWANGNTLIVRVAEGYQRKGKWCPEILLCCSFITGQKTEILDDSGHRITGIVLAGGIRLNPLRFQNQKMSASLLEIGYGFVQNKGMYFDLTILSIGRKF